MSSSLVASRPAPRMTPSSRADRIAATPFCGVGSSGSSISQTLDTKCMPWLVRIESIGVLPAAAAGRQRGTDAPLRFNERSVGIAMKEENW